MAGTPERRLVFISHANPEENDFARWLAAQLANAGYEVWTDVAKLIGGEIFWDDIEDAIRNHSAKCVVVVSKASSKKPGVLDEVAVAVGIERSAEIPNFVIPIRFDDIDFAEFRANITRKNAIDFSASWAEGLQALLKVLDRDKVLKGRVGPMNVAQFGEAKIPPERKTRAEEEPLISNWLPVTTLSGAVSIFDLGLEEKKTMEAMAPARVPWFPYFRLVGTLGTEADLREDLGPEITIERTYHFPVEDFLNGKPSGMPGSSAADTRRLMVSLARQGWNRLMAQRGLLPYEMANGSIAWYVPKDLIPDNKSYYSDLTGKRRSKLLVGRSEKRGVYWHLGVIGRYVQGLNPRFVIKITVLFSEDGKKPLDSDAKLHKLRRGFCRSWWNPQWRDLMLAFIAWLSGGNEIQLPMGNGAALTLSALPQIIKSAVSFSDPDPKVGKATDEEAEAPPPEADDDDGDDDWSDDEDDGEGSA